MPADQTSGSGIMRAVALILILVLLSGCAATVPGHNLVPGQDPATKTAENPWPKRLLIAGAVILGVGMLVAAGFSGARRSQKSTTTKCSGGIYASKCTTTYRGF